jgi:hypothetical protein
MTFFYELKNPKGIKNIKLSQDVNVVICTKKIDTIAITIALLRTKNWSMAPRRVRRINEQYRRNGPVWDIVINDIARDERFMNMPDNMQELYVQVNTALSALPVKINRS